MPRNSAQAFKPIAAVTGSLVLAATLSACSGGASADSDAKTVTVYSADGLKGEKGDGWYDQVFKDFEATTGIKVKYVEGGSGEMVQRATREKSNTQADLLITLPPFIQQADGKGCSSTSQPARTRSAAATSRPTASGLRSSTTTSGSSTTRRT